MFSKIKNSLRLKLILLSMIVETIMLVLLLGNTLRIIDSAIEEQTALRIKAATPLLNAAVSIPLIERDYSSLINILDSLQDNTNHNFDYIVVVDDQDEIYAEMGVQGKFPLDRPYESPSEHIVNLSNAITLANEKIGTVYYGLSLASFMDSKSSLLVQGFTIAVIELLLSLVLLIITGKFLTRNLDALLQQVIEAEKMSALGSLVAGVAHEINTPVGVSLTGVTHINHETKLLLKAFKDEKLGKKALQEYLEMLETLSDSLHFSLDQASALIRSFKQVAVDQHSEEKRLFHLKKYIDDVLLSLNSKFRQKDITVINKVDENIIIYSYAGVFSQIISNLILNSLLHAFDKTGKIVIEASVDAHDLKIKYSDDGKGMDEAVLSKIFEPFFSTKMGQGGSGLGLNILYNLINHTLKGTISCHSHIGKGMTMTILIPMSELIEGKMIRV